MRAFLVSVLLIFGANASAAAQTAPRIFYPSVAQEQGMGGRVTLECPIDEDGRLACAVTEEAPANMGFGAAALRMSQDWRIAPRTRDGVSTAGGRIRRTLVFEPGPPPRVLHE
jgi:TonB family protein